MAAAHRQQRQHRKSIISAPTMFAVAIIAILFLPSAVHANGNAQVIFQNESKSKISIHWINPSTKEQVPMIPNVDANSNVQLNSFEGHSFEIHQTPNDDGECNATADDKTCHVGYFTVVPAKEMKVQTVQINDRMEVSLQHVSPNVDPTAVVEAADKDKKYMDSYSYTSNADEDTVAQCMSILKRTLKTKAPPGSKEEREAMDKYFLCVNREMASTIKDLNDEVEFQKELRKTISAQVENVTCIDADAPSSPDLEVRDWTNERDGVTRPVHVKLDRSTSRIHVVKNFAAPEECEAMEAAAKPKLRRATVADGQGGSQLSENRKAMQAGIKPKWAKEAEGDLVARLSRRVYDYANHVLEGLELSHEGQESLMSIQYFGRGYNDTEPDRYTPHCDGECTGSPHLYGNRMATMVIYCTIPERGGHTNFQNANVHVKPERGAGVFFSYIDPKTKMMDDHLTQHSGCPIYEGEKKIITQWIRYGVDDASPWTSYNTLGIKYSEAGE